jgi:hypothetical protein
MARPARFERTTYALKNSWMLESLTISMTYSEKMALCNKLCKAAWQNLYNDHWVLA